MDCANHASVPNVDYRCDSIATPADSGIAPQAPQDMDRVEMIALTDAEENEPLVLAYTKGNLTTEEHFEQYGFVASAYGSPLDRIRGLPRPPRVGTRASRLKAALKAAVREDLARVWSDLEAREKEKVKEKARVKVKVKGRARDKEKAKVKAREATANPATNQKLPQPTKAKTMTPSSLRFISSSSNYAKTWKIDSVN